MAATTNLDFTFPLAGDRLDLGQRFLRFSVYGLFTITLLAPVIRFGSDFWLKLDQLLLPVIGLVYLCLMVAGLARPIKWNPLLFVCVSFAVCILVSLFYGTQIIGHPLLSRDFFEVPKAFIPVVFFTFAYEADFSEKSLHALIKLMIPITLIICFYALGQWLDLGFTYYLQPFYSGGLHDDGGLAHYRRVYSTFSNPNYLAIFMTWMVVFCTTAALFRVGSRFWNFVILLCALAVLTMTSSRYGLIDTVFGLLLIFLLPAPTRGAQNRRRGYLLAALPILLGAILVVAMSNRATLDRVQQLRRPLEENSLRMRLDGLWKDATDQFVKSPIVGHGPAKVIFGDIATDSEYLDILKEYGMTGFVPYLCYFLVPLALIWRGLKRVPTVGTLLEQDWPATYWAAGLAFIMICTALLMNIGMSTYYNPSVIAFLWMWMGIGASCARRIVQISRSSSLL